MLHLGSFTVLRVRVLLLQLGNFGPRLLTFMVLVKVQLKVQHLCAHSSNTNAQLPNS